MAFTLASVYSTQLREQRLGYISISLDGWADGAAIPVITKGSSFEIGDSIYYCGADLTIDGDGVLAAGATSTLFYAYADPTDSDFVCSATAPTWDDEKQGYYATIGGHVSRCLCSIYKDGSSNYTQRTIWYSRDYGILNTGLSVALGINGDRKINFATDASILWDESEDEFVFNKTVNFNSLDYNTNSSVLLSSKTGAGLVTFYLKKPVSTYLVCTNGLGGAINMGLQLYQNTDYRTFSVSSVSGSSTVTTYALTMNPGLYRLYESSIGSASATLYLYCTGVYGTNTIIASEIVL